MKDQKPLFVDLDGTLISDDLSNLAFIAYLKQNPLKTLFYLFMFLFFGKAYLKEKISNNFNIPLNKLKFNKSCIDHIFMEKNKNRPVYLISGSHQILVDQIQIYLNLFDKVYGTYENFNMVGINKIRHINDNLNYKYFDYIGNSKKDLPIWNYTKNIIFTNVSADLRKTIKNKKINQFEIKANFKIL